MKSFRKNFNPGKLFCSLRFCFILFDRMNYWAASPICCSCLASSYGIVLVCRFFFSSWGREGELQVSKYVLNDYGIQKQHEREYVCTIHMFYLLLCYFISISRIKKGCCSDVHIRTNVPWHDANSHWRPTVPAVQCTVWKGFYLSIPSNDNFYVFFSLSLSCAFFPMKKPR